MCSRPPPRLGSNSSAAAQTRLAPSGGVDRFLEIDEAREHAGDIRIHGGDCLIEGEAGERSGGVAADAREAGNGRGVGRELSAMLLRHGPGGAVEIPRPGVVAEPLPGVEHIRLAGRGERLEAGETGEPALEVGDDRGDLRLLEHELRDEDRVRIGGAPPREIATIAPETRQRGAAGATWDFR